MRGGPCPVVRPTSEVLRCFSRQIRHSCLQFRALLAATAYTRQADSDSCRIPLSPKSFSSSSLVCSLLRLMFVMKAVFHGEYYHT